MGDGSRRFALEPKVTEGGGGQKDKDKGLWVFPLIEVLLLISGDFIHQLVESFTFHCQRNTSVHMFPHSPALLEKQEWGVIPTEGSAENSGGRSTCEVRDDELAV